MVLLALGLNHNTAPISIREKFYLEPTQLQDFIQTIQNEAAVNEAIALNTCNRAELYCGTEEPLKLLRWLQKHPLFHKKELKYHTYQHSGVSAIRHIMRVASGLDSMILGEAEILGQMKLAFQQAVCAGTIGKQFKHLFPYVFFVAKKVRHETRIGHLPKSVAYAAVKLAQHIFSDISKTTVLLVGAGDTIGLTAQHLLAQGVQQIYIANRTLMHAKTLQAQLQNTGAKNAPCVIEVLSLSEIPGILPHIDILISATQSALPIIGKGLLESTLKLRKHKPLFMIDMGLPRDIEAEVGTLEDIYLYCLDDLQQIINSNTANRKEAAIQAERKITHESNYCMNWLSAQNMLKTVKQYRHKCEHQRKQLLTKAYKQLHAGYSVEKILETLSTQLMNQLIHEPTLWMREASFRGDESVLSLARSVFNLKED